MVPETSSNILCHGLFVSSIALQHFYSSHIFALALELNHSPNPRSMVFCLFTAFVIQIKC